MNITNAEYRARQHQLLAQMKHNSVALIPAAKEITRSRDTEFPFRQDSDFFYLTGFNEPDAMLVLVKGEEQKSILYCRAKDKTAEIWHGRRMGADAAKEQLPIDDAYTLAELDQGLIDAVNQKTTLYYGQGVYKDVDDQVFALLNTLRGAPKKGYRAPEVIRDIRTLVHEMRLFKSPAEQEIMRQAGKISADAHKRAMRFAKAGATEYQLEAELHHHYAMNGARYPAYGTIVGSGDNATILHYTENESPLKDGDLVLIDSGCELAGYAADITRTFPVNGKFSDAQKAVYNVVLKAQYAALDMVKPGNTLAQTAKVVNRILTQGLIDLGLLEGELDELLESQAYRAFYMHGLGHWLGLDVHDVGEYKQDEKDRPFEPGMVLTIEPGLYISEDAPVAEQYRGIGIRIEDDVLVTENGHENLTVSVPKEVAEIEALMQES
ncbi:Xaa-Pro aminopeptidase [Pseudoalteromonas sp. BDTF-M6]|uniref:Xaa-Pro aminopeptidase n=1 Tax=Pseudoalteromonas sp. BDTF-M6 TaxID=2796132 RepID=UPI001BB01FF8|nr:Xaa-Pro aminopeptidase [Pseudoalteromonas sp. BDTF-M6]MBS3796133.1 Xaa-Pro aminopeptidase [Pseudoalteromonas sp. BDTF-M6]